MKLQVNTNGSWRDVVTFNADRYEHILHALPSLSRGVGDQAKWCVVHDDGKRQWLNQPLSQASEPAAPDAAASTVDISEHEYRRMRDLLSECVTALSQEFSAALIQNIRRVLKATAPTMETQS